MKTPLLPLASLLRRTPLVAALLTLTLGFHPVDGLRAASQPVAVAAGADAALILPVFLPLSEQSLVRVGNTLTYQVAADNGPLTYSAEGLPPGTRIDENSGLISGIATEEGTFTGTVTATNSEGSSSIDLTLVISPPLPVVTITADVPNGYPAQSIRGGILITRQGDISEALTVNFIIKGSAKNGQDYNLIKNSIKFKAGKDTKRIRITAADESGRGFAKRTVKFLLQTSENYEISGKDAAKVKLNYTP